MNLTPILLMKELLSYYRQIVVISGLDKNLQSFHREGSHVDLYSVYLSSTCSTVFIDVGVVELTLYIA